MKTKLKQIGLTIANIMTWGTLITCIIVGIQSLLGVQFEKYWISVALVSYLINGIAEVRFIRKLQKRCEDFDEMKVDLEWAKAQVSNRDKWRKGDAERIEQLETKVNYWQEIANKRSIEIERLKK